MTDRTALAIVCQTNDIARIALSEIMGFEAPFGFRFFDDENPRSIRAWAAAVSIQALMTDTDANAALSELEEDELTDIDGATRYWDIPHIPAVVMSVRHPEGGTEVSHCVYLALQLQYAAAAHAFIGAAHPDAHAEIEEALQQAHAELQAFIDNTK